MTPPFNAFTVDLEEWYQGLTSTNPLVEQWPHFESRVLYATEQLLAILRRYQIRVTFFVLGHVADQHPTLIERLAVEGHEIAIHGYFHRFVSRMSPAEFAEEVEQSIRAVESITGERPIGHRAPYFSVNATTPWVFEVLAAHGIRYDSSVFPTRNMLYGFPNAPRFPYRPDGSTVFEFPLSTVRLAGMNWPIAGGFYLRALPYSFIRWGIKQLNRQDQPAIIYLHPWELDLEQAYQQITVREKITHYHGRRGLASKLHRLFTDFRFGTLQMLFETQSAETEQALGTYQ